MVTSDVKSNKVLDFFGRTSTIVGGVSALPTMGVMFLVSSNPLISVAGGVVGYFAGYLLSSGSNQSIQIITDNSAVEVETINKNIAQLNKTIDEHSKHISPRIQESIKSVIEVLEDILPQWKDLNGFGEDKYTIDAIISEYIPQMLTDYMNLPNSYYRHAEKARAEENVINNVKILNDRLIAISNRIYEGIEKNIENTGTFLKDKYEYKNSLSI